MVPPAVMAHNAFGRAYLATICGLAGSVSRAPKPCGYCRPPLNLKLRASSKCWDARAENRILATSANGANSPFAAPHNFVGFRGETDLRDMCHQGVSRPANCHLDLSAISLLHPGPSGTSWALCLAMPPTLVLDCLAVYGGCACAAGFDRGRLLVFSRRSPWCKPIAYVQLGTMLFRTRRKLAT